MNDPSRPDAPAWATTVTEPGPGSPPDWEPAPEETARTAAALPAGSAQPGAGGQPGGRQLLPGSGHR